jgi:hypothetical protein
MQYHLGAMSMIYPHHKAYMVALIISLSTGCSTLQLPPICDTELDDLDTAAMSKFRNANTLQPDNLQFLNGAIQTMSARALTETTLERISTLKTWKVKIPSCTDGSDYPVPMVSGHPIGNLVLRRSGAASVTEMTLTTACWKNIFKETNELFLRDTPIIFCDSLDPELMLDTSVRAKNDLDDLEKMQVEGNGAAMLFGGLFMRSSEFYEYQYVKGSLTYLIIGLLEEIKANLPTDDRAKVAKYGVRIVYDTDVLFIRVSSKNEEILISAPVLRSAYAIALQNILPELEALRTQFQNVPADPQAIATFRDHAIEQTEILSNRVKEEYLHLLSFVISHELAHIYGNGISDEQTADCLAVTNMTSISNVSDTDGLFSLIVDDVIKRSGANWAGQVVTTASIERFNQRKSKIDEWFEIRRSKGVSSLRKICYQSAAEFVAGGIAGN